MNKQYYNNLDETLYTMNLTNGLTVHLLPRKEMEKSYAVFSTEYGSIDQHFVPLGKEEAIEVPEGIAHFLEHKLFEKEDRDVFADFSKQGASPNAFTSFTKTAYLFSATSQIEKNVETLIDFVQAPYFSESSVEKEKGIIAQEIKMYDDQPEWRTFMGTIKNMFQNHPVNVDIAGTVDSIYEITKDDLYTCYETFYHPENMVLFVAGNFDVESMAQLIETNQESKSFVPLSEIQRHFPEEPAEVVTKESTTVMPVSIPKCTIGIKEHGEELSPEAFLEKDLIGGMVMEYLFAAGGDFYQELYENDFIDDSFFYEMSIEKNFGYSLIGTNTENPEQFSAKLIELLKRTNTMTIAEADFERMKKKEIGELLRAMNSLEFIANNYSTYQAMGIDLFELPNKIDALTVEQANTFLQNWIDDSRLTVHTIRGEK